VYVVVEGMRVCGIVGRLFEVRGGVLEVVMGYCCGEDRFIAILWGGKDAGWGVFPNVLLGLGGVGGRSFCAARIFFEACSIVEDVNSLGFMKPFPSTTAFWNPLNWLRIA